MEDLKYISFEYEFNNIDDFINLEFKLYNLPEFKDKNTKINLTTIIKIFNNFNFEFYRNNWLIDRIQHNCEYLYMTIIMLKYDYMNSYIKNNIINISDFFPEQNKYLKDLKKSLKNINNNDIELKIKLSFNVLKEPLNLIITNCIGYLTYNDSILLKPLSYYKQNFYIKQYNSLKYSETLINYAYKYNKILMSSYQNIDNLPELINKKIEKYYYL
jgi:hypothetical protein